ncbi:MAG: molybdopterin molybdotransferase MoeA [Cyclobacteriaceae bacterium]|nr:molybdopterin molybdotransferase MoeA [Cyclobacteriaceae bacterium]
MIEVKEALAAVLASARNFGVEEVHINQAIGRVLDENIYADRDFPPFNRVTMDGIAISSADYEKGVRKYGITGIHTAGAPEVDHAGEAKCLEVMTGAMVPKGADIVVRYEDITIADGVATVNVEGFVAWENIHIQGSDRKQGEELLRKGCLLRPSEIAILSTVGKGKIKVKKWPEVAIVSTGDELVGVDESPLPHQIRASNSFALKSALANKGINAHTHHLNDDERGLYKSLNEITKKYDVVILSGGVSRGKKDYVPGILDELGVEKLFHRVAQRPGKPFWFGKSEHCVVFALPGNPVSTFMCFQRYFISWLNTSMGIGEKKTFARLASDFEFKPDLTYFLQVRLEVSPEGIMMGHPEAGQGSGDLANLMDADAFLELPRGRNLFKKGEVFPVLRY